MAYFGELTLDGTSYLVGSTMYGVCNDAASATDKTVSTGTLGAVFNELIPGISVNIQFTNGNLEDTITLKVGSTTRLDVIGNCKCGFNAILQFTYGQVNNVDKWILNAGEKVAVTVLNTYDSTSTEPISGQGVADAIAPLIPGSDNPASLGVDTAIPANPTNEKLPTSLAVANYVAASLDQIEAFLLKGTIGVNGTILAVPSQGYKAGYVYRIVSPGTYAGHECDENDLLIAIADAGQWQVSVNNNHWVVVKTNLLLSGVTTYGTITRGNVAIFGNANTLIDGGISVNTSVPVNAVFTDTKYESSGSVQAITNIDYGTDITFATVSNGTLQIRSGITSTKQTVITGIQEV